jgi:DNA (cytosine-5)-methyltransferase 1
MRYLSVCSGIEAATVAWHPLGWEPAGFAEIEKFPSEVLKHHYPTMPNYGDMTKFKEWGIEPGTIDLLVGGTPCQSFSVAGLRKGLSDPRGNLMLTYGAIADYFKPTWIVWENVPGVLSSNHGRDFGTFLGMLGQLGYGFAYRVLDAQYFGVAQRRRRVFVVGYLGDWRRAAAVLFESESLCGNPAPSREAGKESAAQPKECAAYGGNNQSGRINVATACNAHGGTGRIDFESETFIAHTLRGRGFDASEDGTGRGTPLIPFAIQDIRGTEKAQNGRGWNDDRSAYTVDTLATQGVAYQLAVRRLTPRECERLQGFPDGYTNIKPNCPDGPRYKALGNSMAVPVMRWIGERMIKHAASR